MRTPNIQRHGMRWGLCLPRALCWGAACVAFAAWSPAPAIAQRVRVVVVTETTARTPQGETEQGDRVATPEAPGYIVLLDTAGREVGRAIHNTAGPVTILAPGSGAYRLRSERVGYRSVTSAPFAVRAGEPVERTIDVASAPVRLDTLAFAPSAACRARPEDDPTISAVWGEVRKALVATGWAGGRIHYGYIGNRVERQLNAGGRVTSEQITPATGPTVLGDGLPAEYRDAYVATHDSVHQSFLSAGPGYILSGTFQEDHCFSILSSPGDSVVVLEFTPSDDSSVAGVRGEFLVDLASAELRSLEYQVIDPGVDPEGHTGGTARFMRTPAGRWVVTSWKTRLPLVGRRNGRDALMGFGEVGGRLSWITAPTGEFVYRAPFAELHGTVVDERSAPVAGVTVTLVGTRHTAETDSAGRFAFSGPQDGAYTVSSRYSTIDTLFFAPMEQVVSLAPGRVETVRLVMPAFDAIVRPLCVDQPHSPGQRIVTGVVRDEQAGTVLEGARVMALVGATQSSTVTDTAGFYAICGVPSSVPVDIWAEAPGRGGDLVTLAFDDAGVDRYVRLGSGIGSQSEYRRTASTIWVEDLRLAQLPTLPRARRGWIGFKLGRTRTNVAGTGIDAQARNAFQLGVFYEIEVREQVSVQFEGMFVQQGAFSPNDGRTMALNYLKLPVLAKVRLLNDHSRAVVPYVFAGPMVGFDTKAFRGVPKGDLSAVFGGGATFQIREFSILVDAAYSAGLTGVRPPRLREPLELGPPPNDKVETDVPRFFAGNSFRNRLLSISVGFSIPLGRRAAGPADREDASRPRVSTRDIITPDDIRAVDLPTAYDIVQRLHPEWFHGRRQAGVTETGEPVVYVNTSRWGDIDELRGITRGNIVQIVYFNGRDAVFRFGVGHESGVIQVIIAR